MATNKGNLLLVLLTLAILRLRLTAGASVCKYETLESLQFGNSFGHIYDGNMSSSSYCNSQCSIFKKDLYAIEKASICFCAMSPTLLGMATSTNCSKLCEDGSACGGTDSTLVINVGVGSDSTTVPLPLNISGDPQSVVVGKALKITVGLPNSSWYYWVDWGDGAPIAVNSTSHVYELAGKYTLQAYQDGQPSLITRQSITVNEAPQFTVNCTNITAVNNPINCTVNLTRMGFDYQLIYNMSNATSSQIFSAAIPSSVMRIVGSLVPAAQQSAQTVTTTELTSGYILLGNSFLSSGGYLVRVYGRLHMAGLVEIYIATPTCENGSYCGQTGNCSSSCSSSIIPQACTSSSLCPIYSSCGPGLSCSTGTTPSSSLWTMTLATTVTISSTSFDISIPPLWFPEGSSVALGCKSMNCGAAILYYSQLNSSTSKVVQPDINVGLPLNLNRRYSISLVMLEHLFVNATPELSCITPAPVPLSSVSQPFSATTEQFLFQGSLKLSYTISSQASNSSVTQVLSPLCQQPILPPTFQSEIWIAVNTNVPFQFTFSQGSPVFSKIEINGITTYDYIDNTDLGYDLNMTVIYTKVGLYNISGNSSNAIGAVMYIVVVHVVPNVTADWVISTPCPCYNLINGFSFTLSLSNYDNAPWNATITAIISNSTGNYTISPAAVYDFKTFNISGYSAPITVPFSNMTIDYAANYSLIVQISNEATNSTTSTTVLILEALKDITSVNLMNVYGVQLPGLGPFGNMYLANFTISFWPQARTGFSYNWKITDNVTDQLLAMSNSSESNMTYLFSQSGTFDIVFWGFNSYQGWVPSPVQQMVIVSDLNGLILTSLTNVLSKPGQVMSFNLTFIVFTPLTCIVIDYGDSSPQEAYGYQPQCRIGDPDVTFNATVFPPVILNHTYTAEGQYLVKVKAYDAKNLFSEVLSTVIANLPCNNPVGRIINGKYLVTSADSIRRSLQLRVVANASYVCNATVPVFLIWSVSLVNETTAVSIAEVPIAGNPLVPTWKNSQLVIPPLFLSYGTFKFTFTILIVASSMFNLTASDYTYVTITKTPLIASMIPNSPSAFSRGFGQLLVLNSTLSSDPDQFPNNNPMNATWWCRQVSPQAGALTSPPTNTSYPYPLVNNQSIPAPSTTPNAQATGGGCFGIGDGTLINVGQIITMNTASFVNPNAVYEIILRVSKDTRVAYSTVRVTVSPYPPPNVQITCDPTVCYPTPVGLVINPQQRVPLLGSCTADCPKVPAYNWTIATGSGAPVSLSAPCESQPVPANHPNYVCEKALTSTLNGTTLALSPSFFTLSNTDTNIFEITLYINDATDPASTKGFSIITLHRNLPPTDGQCQVLKSYGFALIDKFPVVSSGWVDPDALGINYYAFIITSNVTGTPVAQTIATSLQLETDLILPVGTFSLSVQAVDVLMGATIFSLGPVTAILPNETQISYFNYPQQIAYSATTGDQTSLSMVLAALSSIRDNAPSLSLNDNEIGNLTTSALIRRITDIAVMNNQQLQAVASSMEFATMAQLNVGANVVQQALVGIFNNPLGTLTVDMSTRTTALRLLQTMAGKLSTVGPISTSDLQSFVSKSMDSCSALLVGIVGIISSGSNAMVPPTDEHSAVNWDYDSDIGYNINQSIPVSYSEQLVQNVRETTVTASQLQIGQIYNTVRKISYTVQSKSLPGELTESQSPNGATMITGLLSEIALRPGYNITSSNMNGSVNLPVNFCPSRYVIPNTDCNKILGVTFLIWPCISHYYPSSRSLLSPATRTLDLEININNNIINVTNETLPIIFKIPRNDSQDVSQFLNVNAADSISPHQPLVYHYFQITMINSGYLIKLACSDSWITNMIFLIDHERMPTLNQHLTAVLFGDFSNEGNNTYSYFIDSIKNRNRTGRFFVGVGVLNSVSQLNSSTIFQKSQFQTSFSIAYNLSFEVSGCYFFDETINDWSSRNLTLLNSKPSLITCSTTHLTPFGSGYAFVNNTINFDYIFANAGFTDNLVTYMLLIILTTLLVIGMIWAHFMDKADVLRVGVLPLPDNKREDKYLYEVTFRTGVDEEASTNSNIWFIASGDYGETDVRRLPPANKNLLYRRFMVNSFVMATPKPLGHINFLRVFHDNTGEPPLDTWQLQMAVFRDLQTSEKSVFDINSWLALNRDEGKVDKIFLCSENEEGRDFGLNMYINSNRIANENNMYMSMFLRPAGSRFNRKERVIVCATFLFLSMSLAAIFYQQKTDSPRNGSFDYGLLTISIEQLITGVCTLLLAYPLTLILTFVFKRARPRKLKKCRALEAIEKQRIVHQADDNICSVVESNLEEPRRPKEKSPVKCIPWWTRVLAWIFAIVIIAGSAFIVWSYCIMWGEIKTQKWVSTFIVCSFISIIVTQWLKIFILATVSSAFCKTDFSSEDIDCDEELPGLKPGEEWDIPKFMDPSIRKKVYRVEGVDDSWENVATLKTRLMKEREMHFVLKELFAYIFFLAIIYILVNGRADYNAFLLRDHLTDAFVNQVYGNLSTYVKSVVFSDDWWFWQQTVLLDTLRAQRNYNGVPPYGLRGFMDDQTSRLMGYAVIRQIRTRRYNCAAPQPLDQYIHHCSGVNSIYNADTQDYCAGWTKNETFSGACQFSEFHYQTAAQVQAYSTQGKLASYEGGGYIIRLSGPQDAVQNHMNILQQNHWIDKNTRAIVIEFAIYNANVNLFAACKIMAEFSESGGAVLSWRFEPVRLITDSGFKGTMTTFGEICFIIVQTFVTLRELWNLKKQKFKYFTSYWNLLETCLLLISYITIGLYFYRYTLTKSALAIFNATSGNGYVRMDAAVLVDQYYLFCLSFIVFFSTLKLIKLLQFNKRMNSLAMTFQGCWDELKIFLIAFLIVFFAFACLFFFLFQAKILEFGQLLPTIATTFQMMLGKCDYQAMNDANPMSPLIFFIFSLCTTMFLVNLMLSIIILSFSEVKKALTMAENKLNLIDHVWFNFKVFLRKERLQSIEVTPVFTDKKDRHSKHETYSNGDRDTDNLPDKINQLMKYVNDVYFDGQLDLSDPEAKKCLIPSNRNFLIQRAKDSAKAAKRLIFSSDV